MSRLNDLCAIVTLSIPPHATDLGEGAYRAACSKHLAELLRQHRADHPDSSPGTIHWHHDAKVRHVHVAFHGSPDSLPGLVDQWLRKVGYNAWTEIRRCKGWAPADLWIDALDHPQPAKLHPAT
jgi:hypothetical protein